MSLASLEEDKKQYQDQLDIIASQLKDDSSNAELLALKGELDDMIKLLDESIAELKPTRAPAKPEPKKEPSLPQIEEKWSRENHPAFKKPVPIEEKDFEVAPIAYQVNDSVLAKWVSGDKAFYPARITSVTGSSTAPIYTVKFKSYDNTETLRAKDIRPVAQKRKADGTPATNGSTPPSATSTSRPAAFATPPSASNGVVTSAAASLYPEAQKMKEAEANADDTTAKPKFKKIKAKKELEAGKSKWQEFNSKSKFGKTNKKDSMFRTPEGVRGRVGFTGSGQTMRKDPTRSRHVYQTNEDLD